jgi:hypothetical protein
LRHTYLFVVTWSSFLLYHNIFVSVYLDHLFFLFMSLKLNIFKSMNPIDFYTFLLFFLGWSLEQLLISWFAGFYCVFLILYLD